MLLLLLVYLPPRMEVQAHINDFFLIPHVFTTTDRPVTTQLAHLLSVQGEVRQSGRGAAGRQPRGGGGWVRRCFRASTRCPVQRRRCCCCLWRRVAGRLAARSWRGRGPLARPSPLPTSPGRGRLAGPGSRRPYRIEGRLSRRKHAHTTHTGYTQVRQCLGPREREGEGEGLGCGGIGGGGMLRVPSEPEPTKS